MDICFYNHYHNGDLFASKGFIDNLIQEHSTNYYFAHVCPPNVTKYFNYLDLRKMPDVTKEQKIFLKDGVLYINTWIGIYMQESCRPNSEVKLPALKQGCNGYIFGCNWITYHAMWSFIYAKINTVLNLNLKLKNVQDCIPDIDHSYFDCKNVDNFISDNKKYKILISNGPALSGQSYNTDLTEIINKLADNNAEKLFISTNKFETKNKNILFTSDIIKAETSDLNEISYLSTFCDFIIGRNSGPFCFTNTKINLSDKNKKFLALGNMAENCFSYGLTTEALFRFELDNDLNRVYNCITDMI